MKAYYCMHATEKFWQVCSVKGKSSASNDELILPFLPCQVRGKLSRNLAAKTYLVRLLASLTSFSFHIYYISTKFAPKMAFAMG